MQEQSAQAQASTKAAYDSLTDKIIDAWSESQLKEFCDKNGINGRPHTSLLGLSVTNRKAVPQGTKVNHLRALVRKHRAELLGDTVSATAASAFGAATSNVGSGYAKATDSASQATEAAFNKAVDTWSESRLKGYLDARGVVSPSVSGSARRSLANNRQPVPHASKTDELRALVRKHSHKAASGWTAWTFDDFTYANLKDYIAASGNDAAKKASEKAGATRDDLLKAAKSAYASASSAGGDSYASATSYLAKATDSVKASTFETWSDSELKSYLDSYGIVSCWAPQIALQGMLTLSSPFPRDPP